MVVLYGEWAGKGVQKKVSISEIEPKVFIPFAIKLDDRMIDSIELLELFNEQLEFLNQNQIWIVAQFGTWEIEIDFSMPEEANNKLIEWVNAVEKECPAGKHFGKNGSGEGIVFHHHSKQFGHLFFKVKGKEHSNSKVKTLNPLYDQKIAGVREFADSVLNEPRLEQGLQLLQTEMNLEPIPKNTGAFIKWIVQDVLREESIAIQENQIDVTFLNKEVTRIAREWFLSKIGLDK